MRLLNQEHRGKEFKYFIADVFSPEVKHTNWVDLGYTYNGVTEALIYPAEVEKQRNETMFEHYIKGWIKNHSVEMIYVQLFLAMNSDSRLDKEERDNWEKYRSLIVNGDEADELGYFWAVTEAKEVGGAAVPRGSNPITPNQQVIDISSKQFTLENDPPEGTQSTGWEVFNF